MNFLFVELPYITGGLFTVGAIATFMLIDWHDKRYITSKRERRGRAEVVVLLYIVVSWYWLLIFQYVFD